MMISLGYAWADISFYSKYIFQIQLPESLILLIKKKNYIRRNVFHKSINLDYAEHSRLKPNVLWE